MRYGSEELELKDLIEDFIGQRIELKKKLSGKEIKELRQALDILVKYRDDLPDNLKSAIDTLVQIVAGDYGYGSEIKKSGLWPSFFGVKKSREDEEPPKPSRRWPSFFKFD